MLNVNTTTTDGRDILLHYVLTTIVKYLLSENVSSQTSHSGSHAVSVGTNKIDFKLRYTTKKNY